MIVVVILHLTVGTVVFSYNDYVDLDAAKEEAPPVIDYRNG